MKMIKRLFCLVLVLACIVPVGVNAHAYASETDDMVVNGDIEVLELSQSNATRTVTDYDFVSYSTNFQRYTQEGWVQCENACVPIAMANVISYFDYLGCSNLISGNTLSQTEYTEICTRTQWTANGTTLENGITGLKAYASQRGYTVTTKKYTLSLWSNITSSIQADYPVIVEEKVSGNTLTHTVFAVGYKIEDGVKYLMVYNGDYNEPMKWLEISKVKKAYRVWIQ